MKLVWFRPKAEARPRLGAVLGNEVFDLAQAYALRPAIEATASKRGRGTGGIPATIKDVLAAGAMDDVRALVRHISDTVQRYRTAKPPLAFPLADVALLPPIPDPGKFICVGKNNRTHQEELKRNQMLAESPPEPTGFAKLPYTLVGHDARVERPEGIKSLDYEPEMVFVIGRPVYRVKKAEALFYVAGVMLLNDLSAREIQRHEVKMATRFLTAKNMPGFAPVGPYFITLDEVGDPHDLWVTCTVNGNRRMRSNTSELIFKIPDILEHYSRYIPFDPGDLFATGSPGGVALGQANADELYLKPGDVVEVAFENLAMLRTYIVAPGEAGSKPCKS